jgi:hypothetical protein
VGIEACIEAAMQDHQPPTEAGLEQVEEQTSIRNTGYEDTLYRLTFTGS